MAETLSVDSGPVVERDLVITDMNGQPLWAAWLDERLVLHEEGDLKAALLEVRAEAALAAEVLRLSGDD